jgi:hypothetical protein
MKECTICGTEDKIVKQSITKCNADHSVCKDCYIRTLSICFCEREYGQPLFICPICRNEHRYNGKEMNSLLRELTGEESVFLGIHPVCKNHYEIPNVIRKCTFDKCGCRRQEIDIINTTDMPFTEVIKTN